MKPQALDGKQSAEKIKEEIKKEAQNIHKPLRLAIVQVGDDPASSSYIEKKKKAGEELGIKVKVYKEKEDISTRKLRGRMNKIVRTQKNKGVIVQLPLPEHINTRAILNTIPPEKDVDVLGRELSGKFYNGTSPILPPTAAGIVQLLSDYDIEVKGKYITVIGFGNLVGKPVSIIGAQKEATVSIINEFTPEETKTPLLKEADIIISGVGKPGVVTKDMIKEGVVIIDAGVSFENGKMIGDVTEDAKEVASYYTPVPGGVGPMTVAMLFWNLVRLVISNK